MADHKEISQRKKALLHDLRTAHHNGDLIPGELAPPVRNLALKYEISTGVVTKQLQILEQEGLFYTVPRTGTFVGQPPATSPEFYLFILRPRTRGEAELRLGFEEEIARRGGTTLAVPLAQAQEQLERSNFPAISGFFLYHGADGKKLRELLKPEAKGRPVPEVNFDTDEKDAPLGDLTYFDNINGGRQAAQHLINSGHERVAFLGVHAPSDFLGNEWSVERLEGWQNALKRSSFSTDELVFLPSKLVDRLSPERAELLRKAAQQLLAQANATAVVCANDDIALQLIEACREQRLPSSQWPAIVSFDDSLPPECNVLTSLHLPWNEVGRTAASLLWERAHGQLTGAPISRLVPMRMIPRLSCRANWSLAESLQYATV